MWRTVGHHKALNTLKRSLLAGRLSHAYLLAGPRNVGKMTLALDIAWMVNCIGEEPPCGECQQCRRIGEGLHADVRVVGIDTQETAKVRGRVTIGIDQVREVQREASLKPYEGRHRVFIVDGAEYLTEEAANCFLKILEEPPEQVMLVLLTAEVGALPSTLVSRCQLLELRPLPVSTVARELETRHGADQQKAEEIARLSGGRLGWAEQAMSSPELLERRDQRLATIESTIRGGLEERFAYAGRLASTFGSDRESARQELALWLEWWRDLLMVKEGAQELVTNQSRADTLGSAAEVLGAADIATALSAIGETTEHLERNINARLALEELMLALPRI